MITLCMIVKNEEETLRNCLVSVKDYVDEIVIVDTGSIDDTKSIALSYTDKVYDFVWGNDFSEARNFSISKASNDWILVLDADEMIIEYNLNSIKEFISEDNNNVIGRIKRINIFSDNFEKKKYIERVNRLFNKNNFKYEGIIHEQVVASEVKKNVNCKTKDVDIVVKHIGYEKEILKKTDKILRNEELLKKAIENNPKDPYMLYQLGKTYFMAKDYTSAYENFAKAINILDNFSYEYAVDLIESYGYTLVNLSKYQEALELEKYKKYYISMADFNFLLGIIYMNNGMFKLAAEQFLLCTEMDNSRIEGVSSFLSYYNIGVIFECLGYFEDAAEYYLKCGNYKPAELRYNNIKNKCW